MNNQTWQRKIVKDKMREYRTALDNYYIQNKTIITLNDGSKAFSLLSPPLGSVVARRRIRYIMNNLLEPGMVKPPMYSKRTPHFVTMAITYKCQCNCAHCSAAGYQQKGSPVLTTAQFAAAVSEVVDMGATCIVFTGGEPLLHDDIEKLIRTVDRSKAICTLFTNAEYVTPEIARRLKKAGLFGAFVSFDYATKSLHDTNRARTGIFEKACDAVKLFQDQGILTGISTFADKEKLANGEMDRIMDLGKKLKVLEVFIFDVIAVGQLKGRGECTLDENDFSLIRRLRAQYNTKPEYPRIIHQTMLTSIAYPCTQEGCPAGVAHMHIRANGDVSPCDFTPLSFGNLLSVSAQEIWQRITENELYAKPSSSCRLSTGDFLAKLTAQG